MGKEDAVLNPTRLPLLLLPFLIFPPDAAWHQTLGGCQAARPISRIG